MALGEMREIRPNVVLECSFGAKNVLEKRVRREIWCQKRFGEESERRKLGLQGVILVGDHPHLWFPSDQASWVKRIQRD